jgi:hypothetical protein
MAKQQPFMLRTLLVILAACAAAPLASADIYAEPPALAPLPASTCSWSEYRLPKDIIPIQYSLQLDVDLKTSKVGGLVDILVELAVERDCLILHSDPGMDLGAIYVTTADGMTMNGLLPAHSLVSARSI